MKCEGCGKEIDKNEQWPGQYVKVCKSCWESGNFVSDDQYVLRKYKVWQRIRGKPETQQEG